MNKLSSSPSFAAKHIIIIIDLKIVKKNPAFILNLSFLFLQNSNHECLFDYFQGCTKQLNSI